ncbi:MAG: PAS domain S-box protein [candidate division Zixibacteria bacterium]|nr:PAS domain S-box protein [candidate division Zixibacteria bacterium]
MNNKKTSYGQDLKTSWFLPLRLAIFLIVVGVVLMTQRHESEIYTPFFIYSILTLVFLFALAVKMPVRMPRLSQVLVFLQIISEVLVEAAIIKATGNITSPFTALFLMTIVSAALTYQLIGTLLTATMASASYGLVILTSSGRKFPQALDLDFIRGVYSSNDELFYTLFLYICIFYLVAFVSGYLSQKIKSKESELRRASESLARVKLETDEILKHLHSGLITIDHFGRIIYFNEAAERITGFTEVKIKGKNCLEAFSERMPQFSEKILSVLKSSQHEQRCEISITDQNGNEIPIGISTSVLEDEIKGVRGVIGIFQNLTDAKKMEEKMRHADRLAAVGELSASIAHEIRNPLASISGSVELLKQELNLEGENQRLMNLIVKESSRLSNILTDFLVYARVKTPNFSKVEINRLVSDVIEVAHKHSSYRDSIKLGSASDDTTIYVSGDDEQIRQVILNLVVNALDSIETEEGEVNIEIEGDSQIYPDQVIISVSDNGGGMTSEVRDKIFTPFFSTKKNGTGLGLAIVRRLVDNMGGKIWVESSPHGGTTFKFTLIKYFKGMNSSDDNEHNIPENALEGMTSESPFMR